MQLDQTNIVIRERSASDTLDISLFVIRRNLGALMLLLTIGVLPFAIANYLMLGWMLEVDPRDYDEFGVFSYSVRHYFWMIVLIVVEAPLATALITRFLGDYIFVGQPRIKDVLRDVISRLGPLLFVQGVSRAGFAMAVLVVFIDSDNENFLPEVLAVAVLAVNLLVRTIRPYINELVLLEQNPLFVAREGQLTTGVRSARLHRDDSSASTRFIIGSVFAVFLAGALINLCFVASGVLFNEWSPTSVLKHVAVPLASWLAAGFVAVTRFLNYLNRRIENEGWEVELRVKAEANRLFAEGRS